MNFGIIGLGNIAVKFAKTINAMKEHTLYGVASRDINKANTFKEEYNATMAYGSYEDLMKDSNIDIVYVATPNSMHLDNAIMALEHGKHLLIEKPITTSPSDTRKLYEIAKEKNLAIMEGLWIRFLPLYKSLLKNLSRIGNIKEISVNYGFDTNPDRKKRKFLSSLGGGALYDIGIYNIGFIDMLLNRMPSSYDVSYRLNEYNTDEYVKASINYDGIIATSICEIGKNIDRVAIIKGDNGQIYIKDFQHAEEYTLSSNGIDEVISIPFEINGFEYQIRELAALIKDNKSLTYGEYESIRVSKILYEIRKDFMKFDYE